VKFPITGPYVLRATATAGTATGTADLRVNVGGSLTAQNVGSSSAPGSWSETDGAGGPGTGGTITLTGAGTGISSTGTTDGFYFLAAPMAGDFDVRCRITSITNPGGSNSCRAGIMVRASTANNAPYAMTLHRADGSHGFQARLTTGADPYDSLGSTQYVFPRWVRLVRSGNDFSAYYGDDGETWTQRGSTQTITTMGSAPLLGLAITSAVTATASTAVFDELSFSLPTNIGPLVDAGPTLTGAGPWNLNGTVTDDGKPTPAALIPLWRAISGPGSVTFTNPSAIDTPVTFSGSGSYRLRLTVSDGAVTTFDETTADVTSNFPLHAWRQTYFGTTSNTGLAANDADPDKDGVPNLLEYALGTSPWQAGPLALGFTGNSSEIVLGLQRYPDRSDLTLTLEAASTLTATPWTAIARSQLGASFTSLAPDVQVVEEPTAPPSVIITIPVNSAQRFFRMRAETDTP
jgi:hypothetical protein